MGRRSCIGCIGRIGVGWMGCIGWVGRIGLTALLQLGLRLSLWGGRSGCIGLGAEQRLAVEVDDGATPQCRWNMDSEEAEACPGVQRWQSSSQGGKQ